MNITLSIIIIVVLFIFAVIRNIDWRGRAVKWVGNNPARSQHYIEAGDTVHTVEGHRILMAAEGQVYSYNDLDKEIYIIDLPKDYPYKYIRGRRIIGQSDGNLVSNPLGFFRPEQIEEINEGLTEISALAQGNTLMNAIHSVKSNKTKNLIIYLIIAAILAGGYMWYRNNSAKPEIAPSANVTQNATLPGPGYIQPGKIVPIYPDSVPANNITVVMPPIEKTLP